MDPTDRAARTRGVLPRLAVLAGAVLSLAVALIAALGIAPRPAAQAGSEVIVVYVGAEDCGPCRAWRRDMRPAFFDSDEFSRLRYREIIAQRLRDLLTQTDWPTDLAELREQVRLLPGAPQWFVLRGGRVLASGAGLSAWQGQVWPVIRMQVRHDRRLDLPLNPPLAAPARAPALSSDSFIDG